MYCSYQIIILVFFLTITSIICEKPIKSTTTTTTTTTTNNNNNKIPLKLLRCIKENNSFYCMKLFLLEKFEYNKNVTLDGNINKEFFDKIFFNKNGYVKNNKYYEKLNETTLNERLMRSFEQLFIEHEIKLYFIPGVTIKIVPNAKGESINFSFKQATIDTTLTSVGRRKKHEYVLQFGLPAILMPGILLGSVLPMMLPALKMATMFSGVVNTTAMIAAFLLLARNAAIEEENKNNQPIYYHAGYH